MTLHQLTTHLLSLFHRPAPIYEDDPRAGSEAEYWLDVCHEQCGIPLVRDPAARKILEDAAKWYQTTGYCARYFQFYDGSSLTISEVVEKVA